MNSTVLLSTAYLAPIHYYCKLFCYENIIIEQHENYSKQSYRNRCNILTANGVLSLTIPVVHNNGEKNLIKNVKIDYSTRWKAVHIKAIESAYRSSPFFIYYADDIFQIMNKQYTFLFDLNRELQNLITNLLKIKTNISFTSAFKFQPQMFDDFSENIHPKINMLNVDNSFKPQVYYQVFQQRFGFVPNLSIIDLLFNAGPGSIDILKSSMKGH